MLRYSAHLPLKGIGAAGQQQVEYLGHAQDLGALHAQTLPAPGDQPP